MNYNVICRGYIMLSIFVFMSLISVSQQHPGLKAGVNFSSFKSDQFDFKNSIGFGGGFATVWVISNKLDFLIDFTYESFGLKIMGREYDFSSSTQKNAEEYSASSNGAYGSILPNYSIIPERLSVNAGFIYGVTWVNDKNMNTIYVNNENLDEDVSLSELSSTLSGGDFYVAIGASGGTEALKVNVRYNLGLKNYGKSDESLYSDLKIKRNFLQVSLSYFLLNSKIIRR